MLSKIFRKKTSWGLLCLRVVVGIIFVYHGQAKFATGLDQVGAFFQSAGLPGALAGFVALAEIVSGLLLILGLFTRFGALMIVVIMLVAIFRVKLGHVGFSGPGGWEFDLSLLGTALALLLSGPGKLSVDLGVLRKELV